MDFRDKAKQASSSQIRFQKPNPKIFQFRDASNVEYDSSSDDSTPEKNEEDGELNPLLRKNTTIQSANNSKKWVEREELSLANAYVDVYKDNQHEN
uniref:Uncharacterized protein n=1 Tax=Lactuca sativa TaxID=4236 RepID=A0A9R1X9U9_LACSA|nr:hypothetical protein LSAT_V11C500254030 [Lactuca sativa]